MSTADLDRAAIRRHIPDDCMNMACGSCLAITLLDALEAAERKADASINAELRRAEMWAAEKERAEAAEAKADYYEQTLRRIQRGEPQGGPRWTPQILAAAALVAQSEPKGEPSDG